MPEPLVCAVMLTKDRSEMAARAVRAFREQTYQNKRLRILNHNTPPARDYGPMHRPHSWELGDGVSEVEMPWTQEQLSIGELRNIAVRGADYQVIIHWDDDDWSHPNRIALQVAHLQSSGADVVGYNEILFWRMPNLARSHGKIVDGGPGQAWIWKNAQGTAGSSFAYWRKTWEQKPFPDQPRPGCVTGEDYSFVQGLNFAVVSGIPPAAGCEQTPRLVASIHGGNTSSYDLEGMIARGSREWRRAPEWDSYVRERMKL